MKTRHLTGLLLCVFALGVLGGAFLAQKSPLAIAGPQPCITGDVNDDHQLDISDATYVLNYLFGSGNSPVTCLNTSDPATIVFLLRHAEDEVGIDPSLTETGRERAAHLAETFSQVTIDHLVVSDLKRTQETLAPLAEQKSMDTTVTSSSFGGSEAVDFVRGLPAGSVAVIAHHSFTIPSILRNLGAVPEGGFVGVSGHDQLWILLFNGGPAPELLPLKY